MIPLLLVLGCDNAPAEFDADAFFDEYAEAACDQVFTCEPDSWLTVEGPDACMAEQRSQVDGWGTDPCLLLDLDQAEVCLADIAVLPCHRLVATGLLPDSCWAVQAWNGDESCLNELDEDTGPPPPF